MRSKITEYKYYPLFRDYLMILIGAIVAGASYTYFFCAQ